MTPGGSPPRVVIKDHTVRDAIIAGVCALLVLAGLVFVVLHFSAHPPGNTLSGIVLEKRFTPAPEEQISFGKKGLKTQTIDGEYLFVIRVDAENRTFEVPVEKRTYEQRSVGDSQTFFRPPSEQK